MPYDPLAPIALKSTVTMQKFRKALCIAMDDLTGCACFRHVLYPEFLAWAGRWGRAPDMYNVSNIVFQPLRPEANATVAMHDYFLNSACPTKNSRELFNIIQLLLEKVCAVKTILCCDTWVDALREFPGYGIEPLIVSATDTTAALIILRILLALCIWSVISSQCRVLFDCRRVPPRASWLVSVVHGFSFPDTHMAYDLSMVARSFASRITRLQLARSLA